MIVNFWRELLEIFYFQLKSKYTNPGNLFLDHFIKIDAIVYCDKEKYGEY